MVLPYVIGSVHRSFPGIILALFIVAPPLSAVSRIPVKITEQGTNVAFATTCLQNGIIMCTVLLLKWSHCLLLPGVQHCPGLTV